MIAVKDIGVYGARAFTDAARLNRREIDLAGDALTMPETAKQLSAGLGRSIEYVQIPIEEVRKNSEDFALMLEWFERVGYNADIPGAGEGIRREAHDVRRVGRDRRGRKGDGGHHPALVPALLDRRPALVPGPS